MMKYDVIIIGAGIAGYSAGIRCLQAGLKTALISQGQSALHFSSGSIDVLGKLPCGSAVEFPFQAIQQLAQQAPEHPYSKVGAAISQQGLLWFQHTLQQHGMPLSHQADHSNHQRITSMGTLKATWLSQPYVYQHKKQCDFKRLVLVSIEGYRDFQPPMLQDNLRYLPEFSTIPSTIVSISIPGFAELRHNPHELRSIDIARLLKKPSAWQAFCDQLTQVATGDDLVILPAIMGNGDGLHLLDKLHATTGLSLHEVPTMPPSLMGIRIEESLSRAFLSLGGIHLKGDKVTKGEFNHHRLNAIYTKNLTDMALYADHFLMATGSYFSQGLAANHQGISEPIFQLDVESAQERAQWRNHDFFAKCSHPFMTFGVTTTASLNPSRQGEAIHNLYCCGSMLAGYDPVFEGCGGGVAIATAYHATSQIIAQWQAQASTQEALV
ncbi:glycerol-3-phosphate dehydrogenase subunit GlpB [Vibrio metschnikovii]|uniref:glycerol-3-phosphate dehydrogenase subunit GlpB n=1 Tax=Vibrio metschnikovii TaxID=28172 RepID=UPI002FC637E1